MAYSEYFDGPCAHGYGYGDYNNDCNQYHTDWRYCSTHYYNVVFEYYYQNYCDGYQTYRNTSNDCLVYFNYTDHVNYTNPVLGAPDTITWGSLWDGDNLQGTYIEDSIGAIKNLNDKIQEVNQLKQNDVDLSTLTPDEQFNPGEIIDDTDYDNLRINLENLWQSIRTDSSGLSDIPEDGSKKVSKSEFQQMKIKVDDLTAYDSTSLYNNHINYSAYETEDPRHEGYHPTPGDHVNYSEWGGVKIIG